MLENGKLLTLDVRYRDSILGVAQQYGANLLIDIGMFLAHCYIVALDNGHVAAAALALLTTIAISVVVVCDFLGGNQS